MHFFEKVKKNHFMQKHNKNSFFEFDNFLNLSLDIDISNIIGHFGTNSCI